MTEIIRGEYGYLKVNSNGYECYGGGTIQGICYKADPKYWLNQENFNKTPLNFPLYAGEYDLVDDEHSHFETKEMLIEAAKEYLYSEELEVSDDNIHRTIVVALLICDWQSCVAYIYNELDLREDI
ncbi:hypothetical protein D6C19_10675 [Ligilactobacillus murinus]|uniref:Uncharacterized protein n=1 Tax=Ligilactobacillus murinus TaxID=1622 RepID=A0A4Q2A6A0_9LACO|nr:hypothetical protein [Ligilactobacillus murinus]RXV64709.1 hypothetical protein D6C19_10675 [Ligilactobacillus murinus]